MQAMILAAGLGTRLLPHTNIRPKPLFPLLNTPLLMLTIQRLKKYGFDHIIVNCHHLREQIVQAVSGIEGIVVIEEEVILGTGGGLRGASPFMRDEPLLVTNGDIYHTVDLGRLYLSHVENENEITMALHDYPRFNNVQVENGMVVGFSKQGVENALAYTGLQVINPQVLEHIQKNTFSCIIEHYRNCLNDGGGIDCVRVDGCYWTDMGTVEDYLALHEGLLQDRIPCWSEMREVRKPYNIASGAEFPDEAEIADWVCVGDATIKDNIRLERCVIWDGVVVCGGEPISDCVVSTDRI